MPTLPGPIVGAIDTATASIVVAAFGFAGLVVTALINSRSARNEILAEERHRRARRRIRELEKAAGIEHEDEEDW